MGVTPIFGLPQWLTVFFSRFIFFLRLFRLMDDQCVMLLLYACERLTLFMLTDFLMILWS